METIRRLFLSASGLMWAAGTVLAVPLTAQGGNWQTRFFEDGPFGASYGLGQAVAQCGDMNGDGVGDFAVSAHDFDNGGTVFVYSGLDQSLIWQDQVLGVGNRYAFRLQAAGDWNGDGLADVLVTHPYASTALGNFTGAVYVRSGPDGAILGSFEGLAAGEQFGQSATVAGDLNGDSFPDLFIGSAWTNNGSGAWGGIYAISGADGGVLWYHAPPPSSFSDNGNTVAALGDHNQDGINDVLVSFYRATDPATGYAEAGVGKVLSGIDGSILVEIYGLFPSSNLGVYAASAGDTNADGVDDLLLYEYWAYPFFQAQTHLYSGVDGSLIRSHVLESPGPAVGVGDLDLDGRCDYALSDVTFNSGAGRVLLISGVDGRVLLEELGSLPIEGLGRAISGRQDSTGDGQVDVLIGAPFSFNTGPPTSDRAGHWRLLNADGWLIATTTEVSLAAGGTVDYSFDFPDDAAGDTYQVLASASGTGVTTLPNNIPIHLTLDATLAETFLGRYPPVLNNPVATLDANAAGTVALTLPAGSNPALLGSVFYLAVACRRPGTLLYRYSTRPVPLQLVL